MDKHSKTKFSFTTEFQQEIIRLVIKDPEGPLALRKVKPEYLTLIEHSLIMEALTKFFKSNSRIPSKPIIKEQINTLLNSKKYVDLVLKSDIPNIFKIVDDLYAHPLRDADIIKKQIYQFSAFIEMKHLNESFDLADFGQYQDYANKVNGILQKAEPKKKEEPIFMVRDTMDRQFNRQAHPSVSQCPFKQINELTNGGGFPRGSVIVLLDKAKAKKTFTLVNVSRGYLAMKKNVLYIDTENGKAQIMDRMIQSTLNKTKKDMQTGDYDKLEQRQMRKYKRLNVEFIVERVPAMITDCNRISQIIAEVEKKHDIKVHILIIDYAAKLASINKDKDDNDRLFNVYVEIQNMAEAHDIEHIWTANHITREGSKHKATRYEENDIASAISIVRNAQAIFGLNSTKEEEENNVQRMEVVVQRDGKPHGRALFNLNVDTQRMVEFNRKQREAYDEQYAPKLDKEFNKRNTEGKTKEGNGDI